MDKSLYIAMSGAKNNMLAQQSHANNLANVNTTAFKSDFAQARSMPIYYGDGHPTRAYALTERPATDLSIGSLNETGRDLDVAIEGEGFIAVQAPDGSEAYTRVGSLFMDNAGLLRTGSGLPVLGNGGGPIVVPPSETIEIAMDGNITVIPLGQGPDAPAQIDRIKLVNPNPKDVSKSADGLFRVLDDPEIQAPDANVKIISGFLETSNVNAVNELTGMLTLARQYEMQVKFMSTAKETSEASAGLLRFNS